MMRRPALTGSMVLLCAAAASAAESYVGTVTPVGGKPTTLTLTVREYTSDDRAFALAETLHKDGQAAVVAELQKTDVGSVSLGDQAPFRVTLVREQKTASGRILLVVTDRTFPSASAPEKPVPGDAVGYLELKLDAAGAGSGQVLTAVKATFDAEGYVAPEGVGETWPVANVKRQP